MALAFLYSTLRTGRSRTPRATRSFDVDQQLIAPGAHRDRSSRLRTRDALHRVLVTLLVIGVHVAPAIAGDPSAEEMRSLDERVQAIKTDVLGIAAELTQLEEKLLYPSNTQVAVFVAMPTARVGELDAIEIRFDGAPAAAHIYTFKELEALGKGGVQRLYTGNLQIGEHELVVSVTGTSAGGRSFVETRRFTIEKQVEPKVVTLELARSEGGEILVALGDG